MIRIIIDIGIGCGTILLLTLISNWTRPLGGIINSFLPLLFWKLGKFGKKLHYFMFELLCLSFLFKATGYMISSSGLLISIILIQKYWPWLFTMQPFLWGAFFTGLLTTLSIMHDVHLMRSPDFNDIAPAVFKFLKKSNVDFYIAKIEMMRLARSHYADMCIINLFIIISSYGITSYFAVRLGLLKPGVHSILLSPLESVQGAFSFLRFLLHDPISLTGPWALPIAMFYSTCVFVYLTFFLSLTTKFIDEALPEDSDVAAGETAVIIDKFEALVPKSTRDSPPNPIKQQRPRVRAAKYAGKSYKPRLFRTKRHK